MKYLIVLSLIAAVASAGYLKPAVADSAVAEVQEIIAAIHSPSTDPATAAALEQLLFETLGISGQDNGPISVGPAIVEESSPISVGPAFIDFPVPDGGLVTAELPVVPETPALVPSPVVDVSPAAIDAVAPLVQIILNIQKASSDAAPVAPAPVEAPVSVHPVNVVDQAVNVDTVVPTPVQVVEVAPTPVNVVEVAPTPVNVVEVAPTPVQVVEAAPTPVAVVEEPVLVAVLPEVPAAVNLPDILN